MPSGSGPLTVEAVGPQRAGLCGPALGKSGGTTAAGSASGGFRGMVVHSTLAALLDGRSCGHGSGPVLTAALRPALSGWAAGSSSGLGHRQHMGTDTCTSDPAAALLRHVAGPHDCTASCSFLWVVPSLRHQLWAASTADGPRPVLASISVVTCPCQLPASLAAVLCRGIPLCQG